jgi:pyruvate dehydrogenase E1 component alpha subunit
MTNDEGTGTSAAGPPGEQAASGPALEQMLARMYEIRFFEDTVQDWFAQGLMRGSTHLCQGQEAVPVGVTSVLRPGDTTTCTYRGHGALLAQGAPVDRCFAEILGRATGLCGGKGGSMHLTDFEVGALGSFAIVGAHLPITAGAAWAYQLRGEPRVSVCFFGDGATNIGTFHETLNVASVWKLPAVFVVENNLYGEYSPIASTTSEPRLYKRAASYAMWARRVDGNDVEEVAQVASVALERARNGEGPSLVEAMTYRQAGHSRADTGAYRPAGELDRWKRRDPLVLAEDKLRRQGWSDAAIAEVRAGAEARVAAAAQLALAAPEPSAAQRFEHVWSGR